MRTAEEQLFARLSTRGYDPANYWQIKGIVTLGCPQDRYRFFKQFGERTIDQVLRQIDRSRTFLAKSCLLSGETKAEAEKSIALAEMLAWMAIREINFCSVGQWTIQSVFLPTAMVENGDPQYDHPNLRITAIHRKTGEERVAIIPGSEQKLPALAKAWRRAYEQLGIWDQVYRGSVHKGILSAREPQGWTVFTKEIIPKLYEYQLPYYAKPGHYSQNRDQIAAGKAQFPKEIFEDMLLILRIELPGFFDRASARQLKSVIQRYLDSRGKSTNSPKNSQKPTAVLSLPSVAVDAL